MKTFVITGGNSGLGFETAKRLAAGGDALILACRNKEKGEAAVHSITRETGNPYVEFHLLDLASLASVRRFADGIKGRIIDGLDNNAGISGMHSGLTEDGMDVVFQSNHLGHFLLTYLLLDQIAEEGRILNVSSDMHDPPYGELVWKGTEILAHPSEEVMKQRYYYSKLCNLYFTYELDRRLKEKGSRIVVNALNPGFMGDTNLAGGHMTAERIAYVKEKMPERYGELPVSADAAAALLRDEMFRETSGKYFDRSTRSACSSALSYDTGNARQLWEASMRLSGLAGE